MKQQLHIIDGETLMNTPLTPIPFVVDGLIVPWLHLLAGAAKMGKSWLALWLSVAVAKGEDRGIQTKQDKTRRYISVWRTAPSESRTAV